VSEYGRVLGRRYGDIHDPATRAHARVALALRPAIRMAAWTRKNRRVADAIADLKLNYAVIASVDRDDLPDGGAKICRNRARLRHDHPERWWDSHTRFSRRARSRKRSSQRSPMLRTER
jgi:hypothetical protein